MDRRVERAVTVGRAVVHEVRTENVTFIAGSVAYHAFVSLLPLVVLLLTVATTLGDDGLSERVLALVEAAFTPTGREVLVDALAAEGVSGVSLLGLAVLVWATLRIFRGLDQAFSEIYETEGRNTFLDQVGDGLLVLVVVAAAVLVAVAVRSVLVLPGGPLGGAVATAAVVVGLTVAFLPMYYVFPDRELRVLEVLPGTVFAAVGVTALESLFRVYVQFSGTAGSYGVLGAILVLLTWLYFNGLVVLLGAVLNTVLTNHSEDVDLEPVIGDWRPGLGRTFGDAGGDPERALADRLARLEAAVDGDRPVTVQVDAEQFRLPAPASATVASDEDGRYLELRWPHGDADRETSDGQPSSPGR
jgi:membrane protein